MVSSRGHVDNLAFFFTTPASFCQLAGLLKKSRFAKMPHAKRQTRNASGKNLPLHWESKSGIGAVSRIALTA
jgi:hypothetical protein